MRAIARSIFWWSITIATLFILDDLLFGPIFWTISAWSQPLATILAFVSSVSIGQWLIRAGLSESPGRIASGMLRRLSMERKNVEVAHREEKLRAHATHYVGATAVSLLIGEVIPMLVLNKRAIAPRAKLIRFSWIPTIIYGVEFALLHGGYGIGAIVGPWIHHLLGG